jgi:ferredoxin
MKRDIIQINEAKCTGCGSCVTGCPEGALQLIDGKARVVSDLFCDGLGACIGGCPEGAIDIETREAEPYDEYKVMENIAKAGPNVIKAHLQHLKKHGQEGLVNEAINFLEDNNVEIPDYEEEPMACGCPGSMTLDLRRQDNQPYEQVTPTSELGNWPILVTTFKPQRTVPEKC